MATQQQSVQVKRWSGGQHPTMSNITRIMKAEGLRPYMWTNQANYRYALRSHGYSKVLFVLQGKIEINLPDINQTIRLRAGDRIDIPRGIRHSAIVGSSGAHCIEAALRSVSRHRH